MHCVSRPPLKSWRFHVLIRLMSADTRLLHAPAVLEQCNKRTSLAHSDFKVAGRWRGAPVV